MKKIIGSLTLLACIIGFSSCGMKECECYSTNVTMKNDSIIHCATDTVSNFTRGTCDEFNQDVTYVMDESTNVNVHHTIICNEN